MAILSKKKPKATIKISIANSNNYGDNSKDKDGREPKSSPLSPLSGNLAIMPPGSPIAPSSPSLTRVTDDNTNLNRNNRSTGVREPTYSYRNNIPKKSILKKEPTSRSNTKRVRFQDEPTIWPITPIADIVDDTDIEEVKASLLELVEYYGEQPTTAEGAEA
ncbi:MAG: hypothetical protein M1834_009153 [Cirrosporium novae-zelandiae]|nr:MAG: hypothetical protein M1834_009153 [Cirrosporium novae-zelandiae]